MSAYLPPVQAHPPALVRIMHLKAHAGEVGHAFKGLRARAQKRAAYTLGVQSAVAWRYRRIDKLLDQQGAVLSRIYNFRPFLIDNGRVMPPIVRTTQATFRVINGRTATASQATYQVIAPARIVTRPPSWRGYLLRNFQVIDHPNPVLLPRNAHERRRWIRAVKAGWKRGVAQADEVFRVNLARLKAAIEGVMTYRWLAREGVISMPYLARGNLGIVRDKRKLVIGGRVYRISVPSQWRPARQWKALASSYSSPKPSNRRD